jgi:hypothetical protein
VVILRKGRPGRSAKPSNIEERSAGPGMAKRCEGPDQHPKRGCGWDRTRLGDIHGAQIWTGHAVQAHNLFKIPALTA